MKNRNLINHSKAIGIVAAINLIMGALIFLEHTFSRDFWVVYTPSTILGILILEILNYKSNNKGGTVEALSSTFDNIFIDPFKYVGRKITGQKSK